jgi:hypothetical protein
VQNASSKVQTSYEILEKRKLLVKNVADTGSPESQSYVNIDYLLYSYFLIVLL